MNLYKISFTTVMKPAFQCKSETQHAVVMAFNKEYAMAGLKREYTGFNAVLDILHVSLWHGNVVPL